MRISRKRNALGTNEFRDLRQIIDLDVRRQAGILEGGVPVGDGGIADLDAQANLGVAAAQHVPGEGVAHIGHFGAGNAAAFCAQAEDLRIRLADAGHGGEDHAGHLFGDAVIL